MAFDFATDMGARKLKPRKRSKGASLVREQGERVEAAQRIGVTVGAIKGWTGFFGGWIFKVVAGAESGGTDSGRVGCGASEVRR